MHQYQQSLSLLSDSELTDTLSATVHTYSALLALT